MQSMATDMRRLNMALEVEEQGGRRVPSSPSVCSMQTDNSNGCASPAVSDCFNPFDCPSVQSRGSPRPPLGGMCAALPLLEGPIAAITGHPAYALRIALDRKGIACQPPSPGMTVLKCMVCSLMGYLRSRGGLASAAWRCRAQQEGPQRASGASSVAKQVGARRRRCGVSDERWAKFSAVPHAAAAADAVPALGHAHLRARGAPAALAN